MDHSIIQIMSAGSSAVGLTFAIITCAHPNWKVEHFSTTELGLWEWCRIQSTGLKVCTTYKDPTILSADMQAGRVLTVSCIMVSTLALLAVCAGSNFTSFINNEDVKRKVRMGAEIALLFAGLFLLTPVMWSSKAIERGYNKPLNPGNQIEEGACIYTGWVGGVFLLLAQGLLYSNRKNSTSTTTAPQPSGEEEAEWDIEGQPQQ